jgi:hypothetical protein
VAEFIVDTLRLVIIIFCANVIIENIIGYIRRDFYKNSQEFIFSNVRYNPVLTDVIVRASSVIFVSNRFPCSLHFKVKEISDAPTHHHIHIFGRVLKGDGDHFAEKLSFLGKGQLSVRGIGEHDYVEGCFFVLNFMEKVELPWEKLGGGRRKKRIKLPWSMPVLRPAFQPAHQPV